MPELTAPWVQPVRQRLRAWLLPALRVALIAPDIAEPWHIRGATAGRHRSPFSAGVGPGVRGTAEALLMAIAGRRGVASELSGPGQRKLAGRTSG